VHRQGDGIQTDNKITSWWFVKVSSS